MVEVPSLLVPARRADPRVDFLSVGSNDLVQFLFAADRGNNARRRPLRSALAAGAARADDDRRQGHAGGKPVALCGELASKPIGALALIALGFRALSLTPSALGAVKAMLLDLDAGRPKRCCARWSRPAAGRHHPQKLEAFAAAEGLQL
jgi:phosphotransferase system enzyme I (PtsP)